MLGAAQLALQSDDVCRRSQSCTSVSMASLNVLPQCINVANPHALILLQFRFGAPGHQTQHDVCITSQVLQVIVWPQDPYKT